LLSYPLDIAEARAHLASSIYLQMALHPDIVHVVGHTEADHAATADDVIDACTMAKRAINNALNGAPDMTTDPKVRARSMELVDEAKVTLDAITSLSTVDSIDPCIDSQVLSKAVQVGILDAPQLINNPYGKGRIKTSIIEGACRVVDDQGNAITERERLHGFIS
jgi:hypothetical protein